jgi:hypothetical protein
MEIFLEPTQTRQTPDNLKSPALRGKREDIEIQGGGTLSMEPSSPERPVHGYSRPLGRMPA